MISQSLKKQIFNAIDTDLFGKILKFIDSLAEEEFKALIDSFINLPIAYNKHQLINGLRSSIAESKKMPIVEFVEFNISVYTIFLNFEISAKDFIKILFNMFIDDIGESTVIESRLNGLILNSKPVSLIAKANDVYNELPRKLVGTRILTDFRPVFGDDLSDVPASGIIVHTLVLTYVEGSNEKEFHINLDNHSLNMIESAIIRARAKDASISSLLKINKLSTINRSS